MGGEEPVYEKAQKTHRPSKVDVRNKKEKPDLKGKNPKAFTVQNAKRVRLFNIYVHRNEP